MSSNAATASFASLYTSISAMVMVGPRIYAQMADDGVEAQAALRRRAQRGLVETTLFEPDSGPGAAVLRAIALGLGQPASYFEASTQPQKGPSSWGNPDPFARGK